MQLAGKKIKKILFVSIVTGTFSSMVPQSGFCNEMPTNPQVQSGKVNITGTGTNHLQVNTKTNKTINQIKNISQSTKVEPKKELKAFPKGLKKLIFLETEL